MGKYFDFRVKFDPDLEDSSVLIRRILYALIIKRIKAKKPVVLFMGGNSGEGKTQPKGSLILMADGQWKKVEDIKIGDIILSPQEDGSYKYSKVIDLHNRFSKSNYDVYQLNKQKKKLYSCSDNHIIPLYHKVKPKGNKNPIWKFKNYEARDLAKLSIFNRRSVNIGFSSFLIPKYKDRINPKIDPYTLGIFLGDGFYKDYSLNITSPDVNIMDYIHKKYPIMSIRKKQKTSCRAYHFSCKSKLAKELFDLGLKNKLSGNKFIPKEALLADSEYRKGLLAGLIDSDGFYYHGGYNITTKSEILAKDILDLVYSLGGRGNIKIVKKSIKKLNFSGNYFHVSFYIGNLKLPLKTERRKRKYKKTIYLNSNRIALNLKKGSPCQVYGFTLDSASGWYITDNWMVTHNSFCALRLQELLMEIQGMDLKDHVDNINVFTPLEYPTKLDALLFNKELKKINIICMHEARDIVKAKKWNTFLNQSIADVNAMSRTVKRLCFIVISQFIRDITTDTRYTLNYYITVERPIGKKPRLYISIIWKDDRDLEKPKIRKRRLKGYIIDKNGKQRIFQPKFLELSKPSKEIIEIFEKRDFEAKAKVIRHKIEKLITEMKTDLDLKNNKVNTMVDWYMEHQDNLNIIGKRYRGKWKVKPEVKEMHDLSDLEAREFEEKLNKKMKDTGMIEDGKRMQDIQEEYI